MSGAKGAPETEAEDLKTILKKKKIGAVLFIDDAFEPLANFEPSPAEAEEIWEAIQQEGGSLELAIAGAVTGPEQISSEFVQAGMAGPEPLAGVLRNSPYVVTHESKRQVLEFAIKYLQSLEVDVRTSGRDGWEEKMEGVKIVFLDWRLGADNDPDAVDAAAATARKIHEQPEKPLIVLISSNPALPDQSDSFRDTSGLIPGLFDTMPKGYLRDQMGVDLHLASLCELVQAGHVVQDFVHQLKASATDSMAAFARAIDRLTLSDYANLQHFALKKDGHPLGDYLTNLFSGLWADTLFQGAVRAHLAILDAQAFEMLPAVGRPTAALADLYNSAMFDTHVGGFARHPHAEPPAEGATERLLLTMGDVIVETAEIGPARAYMVASPQCDLAESPRHSRRVQEGQTVVLIPGDLVPIDAESRGSRRDLSDTPFFVVDDQRYRIQWDLKALVTVPYVEFDGWLAAANRHRRARMRPLYALALQHSMTADLARVGLPSPPPMYQPTEITFRGYNDGDYDANGMVTTQGRFVMARGSEEDQLILDRDMLNRIKESVVEGLARLEASDNEKDKEAHAKLAKSFGAGAWEELAKPITIPKTVKKFMGDSVFVCREGKEPDPRPRNLLACVTVRASAL